MRKHRYIRLFWPLFLLFILVPIYTGCNSSTAGPAPTTVPTSNTSIPTESSTKGPGAANLTATALATPIPTVCTAIGSVAPASTLGWKVYSDHHFPFRFSVPPGWRAGATTGSSGDGSYSYYVVQVFPPGSTSPFDFQQGIFDAEHFEITIVVSGADAIPTEDHTMIPERTSVEIGNNKTTMYDQTSSACEEVDRNAFTHFAQHQYNFHMKSVPAKARNDIALFLGMLQSFMYTG